ncbi:twin-arginine translocase TatA/TatE family subunit [Halomarina litorea]|uniref:twin-arginine translocase TatA/TatE family subunit n=1 Tax=Halomarina litorea TaxID=2961595 RepID=UPI0020C5585E|nr:twin-arginine translocase TatA/TatE family subunit [Halomarina sp. BCD28]
MATTLVPLFPGLPGGIEIFVVLLIVVLLFGANKLPKLARSSGQAMGEFKKGREEIEQELAEMKGEGSKQGEATADTTTTTEPTTTESTTETTMDETAETEAEKQN